MRPAARVLFECKAGMCKDKTWHFLFWTGQKSACRVRLEVFTEKEKTKYVILSLLMFMTNHQFALLSPKTTFLARHLWIVFSNYLWYTNYKEQSNLQ